MDASNFLRPCLLLLAGLLLLGCQESPVSPEPAATESSSVLATAFNRGETGSIKGTVRWVGRLPRVPGWKIRPSLLYGPLADQQNTIYPNPNAPHIDQATRGVAEAVVFLRQVQPSRSRSWHHPPVQVEFRDGRLEIVQGDWVGRVGFVRCGDRLRVVSREEGLRSVRVRWAAFFTLGLPQPHQVRTRPLTEPGLVEISEGTGRHWLRGYLFVTTHPYYTRTSTTGTFELDQVPPGKYQLVAWMPSWVVSHQDRETEAKSILRSHFRPPVELLQEVEVPAHGQVKADFAFCTALFD